MPTTWSCQVNSLVSEVIFEIFTMGFADSPLLARTRDCAHFMINIQSGVARNHDVVQYE